MKIYPTTFFFYAAMFVILAPYYAFSQTRCYESRSMCEDIVELGTRKVASFPNPVFMDSDSEDLDDTWGAARRSGNTHKGTDIFADKGAYIVMPTAGVVDRTGTSGLGGKHVFVYIGGGEKLYFAHLDDWAPGLDEGDVLKKGDLVGYIGNTGAEWARDHLHLTIYENGVAINAFSRMDDTDFTLQQRMNYLGRIIDDARDEDAEVQKILSRYGKTIRAAIREEKRVPKEILDALDIEPSEDESDDDPQQQADQPDPQTDEEENEPNVTVDTAAEFTLFENNMGLGRDDNPQDDVIRLQRFLNEFEDEDLYVSGIFNNDTTAAVKRFQNKYDMKILDIWGLEKATGFVGITTRLQMNYLIQSKFTEQADTCPVFSQYNSRSQNTVSNEVRSTQELLSELDLLGEDLITGTWDQNTHLAMVAFQEKFSATMLKPWGLTRGTGYKYKTTNKFMNYLRGCDTGAIELDGKGTFDF